MALNKAMIDPKSRLPIPLPDEMTLCSVDNGRAELVLTIPDVPPSGINSTSGGSGGTSKMKARGSIILTDQRLVFIALPDSTPESLTVPLHSILSTHFEQPTFSSNYFAFEIKPSGLFTDSGLTNGTQGEIRFKDSPMFEFVALLEKTREKVIYMRRQKVEDLEDDLPTYTSPDHSSGTVSMVGEVPIDNPPEYHD